VRRRGWMISSIRSEVLYSALLFLGTPIRIYPWTKDASTETTVSDPDQVKVKMNLRARLSVDLFSVE
jgi:hypothetical protein